RKRGQKAPWLQPGDAWSRLLDTNRTRVLLYQAGETAKLAGETRSPHKPLTGCSLHETPGPAGDRQGATGVRISVARPVDGPLETALERSLRTVKRRSRRRKQLRGSRAESPACRRGSLKCRPHSRPLCPSSIARRLVPQSARKARCGGTSAH